MARYPYPPAPAHPVMMVAHVVAAAHPAGFGRGNGASQAAYGEPQGQYEEDQSFLAFLLRGGPPHLSRLSSALGSHHKKPAGN